jgi:hypothetical protein
MINEDPRKKGNIIREEGKKGKKERKEGKKGKKERRKDYKETMGFLNLGSLTST